MRKIENFEQWAKGKTIASVNTKSVNCIYFAFTDGTFACIDSETIANGFIACVPYSMERKEFLEATEYRFVYCSEESQLPSDFASDRVSDMIINTNPVFIYCLEENRVKNNG